MSELSKRVLVAIVGIPLAILIFYMGGLVFAVSISVLSSLMLWEFYTIVERKGFTPLKYLGIVVGLSIHFSFYFYITYKALVAIWLMPILLIVVYTTILFISKLWTKRDNHIESIGLGITGIIYISMSMLWLTAIRSWEYMYIALSEFNIIHTGVNNTWLLGNEGDVTLWFILAIFISIWTCDSAAYFIGRKFGKHKLFPIHSPKKSWEGAIGGFIFGALFFHLIITLFIKDFPTIHSIVLGLITASFGQIGDLVESQLKRSAAVKDSSQMIPGHGGFLDRFDSIVFVMPFIFIYLLIITVW